MRRGTDAYCAVLRGCAGILRHMPGFVANPYWIALTTEQRAFAIGSAGARRFPADVLPFAAVEAPTAACVRALHDVLAPGEAVFVADGGQNGGKELSVAVREADCGLLVAGEHPGLQMHHAGAILEEVVRETLPVVSLTGEHADEMVALTDVAFPGFFRRRTCALGTYVGIRDRGTLVAMAGERLRLPGQSEISAVCTHPEYLGRGYAARLVTHLLRLHRARGVASMLHVLADNRRAIALYERLGFVLSGELLFDLIRRTA